MTDRMEQEISETALSNHVVHPSQGDWSTENWRSFVKAYITWLDMCIYSCIYSYVCIHLPIWCDSDYIIIYYFIYIYLGGVDTRNFLRLIFGVSCGTMLWRGIWSLNRCCPMPARCPAGNRDLGARKKRLKSVFGTCLFLPDIDFCGQSSVPYASMFNLPEYMLKMWWVCCYWLLSMGHFFATPKLEGLGLTKSKNNMKRTSLECVQTGSPRTRRQWILFSGNSLGVANLGDSGGRLRFTQADWGLNTWILEPVKIQNINIS